MRLPFWVLAVVVALGGCAERRRVEIETVVEVLPGALPSPATLAYVQSYADHWRAFPGAPALRVTIVPVGPGVPHRSGGDVVVCRKEAGKCPTIGCRPAEVATPPADFDWHSPAGSISEWAARGAAEAELRRVLPREQLQRVLDLVRDLGLSADSILHPRDPVTIERELLEIREWRRRCVSGAEGRWRAWVAFLRGWHSPHGGDYYFLVSGVVALLVSLVAVLLLCGRITSPEVGALKRVLEEGGAVRSTAPPGNGQLLFSYGGGETVRWVTGSTTNVASIGTVEVGPVGSSTEGGVR